MRQNLILWRQNITLSAYNFLKDAADKYYLSTNLFSEGYQNIQNQQ